MNNGKYMMLIRWQCLILLFIVSSLKLFGREFNPTVKDSINQLVQKGKVLSKNKEYSKAIDVFNQALKISAENGSSNDASLIYKNIGVVYYKQGQSSKAKKFYKKSISADSLSQSSADSYFNLALIYRKEKHSDSLVFNLYKSLRVYERLQDSEIKFSTFYKAGVIFRNRGDYNPAITYLLKAYEGFEEFNNDVEKAKICNAIGTTQRLMGNLDIARQYYQQSVKLREEIGDSIPLSFGYNNLGNLYKGEKQYDSASFYYRKAIRIQNKLKRTKNLGKYYYNLGTINYLQDDLTQARENYKKSANIKKRESDSLFLASSYNELAMVAVDENKSVIAKQYLDSSSVILSQNESKEILLRNYKIQSKYYEMIGNAPIALDYYKRYSSLYESLFEQKQASTIQELQERFENKQKLQKIQELIQGTVVQKEVITKQKKDIRQRDWLLLLAFMLILLAIVIYFYLRQRFKTKEKGLEIHRLKSIFKGQETVKEKISKDLHDIVTTSFDAIRLKILALPKAKKPKEVSNAIVSEISEINKQIRLISHRLSPLGDKIKGTTLSEIIVDQLTEFQYYRKIFVDIQLPLPHEIDTLSLAAQTNLYGIILEVLHNIEKHAQATEIRIRHTEERDVLSLIITDNGIGFKKNDSKGVGLMNMKQRAQLLLGDCLVSSNEKGTEVVIQFPIKPNKL